MDGFSSGVGPSSLLGGEGVVWRAEEGAVRGYLDGAGEGEAEGILSVGGAKGWVESILIF